MIGRMTILALLLGYCGTADAFGSLRCQGRIIDTGITKAQVLALCGPPSSRLVEQTPVRHGTIAGFSRFGGIAFNEQWQYDRGWGKFPAVLLFRDGALVRIEYLRFRSRGR